MATKLERHSVDHVIIGAGPVGILYALKLHKLGKRVLVIDREPTVGGLWKGTTRDGVFFENGLHWIHHPAQWNEFLFDMGEELPLSLMTDPPLVWETHGWKLLDSSTLKRPTQAFVSQGLSMVSGGMGPWLEKLIEKHKLPVRLGESIKKFELCDHGIAAAYSQRAFYEAPSFILTGNPNSYRGMLPPKALSHATNHGTTQPAIAFQFLLKRPIESSRAVHIIHHRMDHVEHTFFGIFESNLDPTRAPEGRQTATWMCFVDAEEFLDTSALTRWRRALKRALAHSWKDWETNVLWERFLALPEAGGPEPLTAHLPERQPTGHKRMWQNSLCLTHCTPHKGNPFFWTTEQLVGAPREIPSTRTDSNNEIPATV